MGEGLRTYQYLRKFKTDPWWPGIVGRVGEEIDKCGQMANQYLVNFIGDNSHATLPRSYVFSYEEKYQEFGARPKQTKLKESIAIANKILKGKTTYIDEVKRIEQRKLQTRFNAEEVSSEEGSLNKKQNISSLKKISKIQKKDSLDLSSLSLQECQGDWDSSKNLNRISPSIKYKVSCSSLDLEDTPFLKSTLDNEFQQIITLLLQPKPMQDKIATKLHQILEQIEKQLHSTSLSETNQGNIGNNLNAIHIILKTRQQKLGGDQIFQKEILEQMQFLKNILSKMEQKIQAFYFDPQSIIDQLPPNLTLKKQFQDTIRHQSKVLGIESSYSEESESDSEHDVLGSFPKKRPKVKNNIKVIQKKKYQRKQVIAPKKEIEVPQLVVEEEVVEEQQSQNKQRELNQQIYEKQQLQRQLDLSVDNCVQYADPELRKRVCHKMAKLLREKYRLDKAQAQQVTIKLESQLRLLDPSMKSHYKEQIACFMQNVETQNEPEIIEEYDNEILFQRLWELLSLKVDG